MSIPANEIIFSSLGSKEKKINEGIERETSLCKNFKAISLSHTNHNFKTNVLLTLQRTIFFNNILPVSYKSS